MDTTIIGIIALAIIGYTVYRAFRI